MAGTRPAMTGRMQFDHRKSTGQSPIKFGGGHDGERGADWASGRETSSRHHRPWAGDPDQEKRSAFPIEMAGTRPAMTGEGAARSRRVH
ncbi:hypothetical protein DC522_33995 [Microvirga sp. KLBC 81]|nr:hypothetical protein DC522_33995 [Microvirga sp. KLBC 81]